MTPLRKQDTAGRLFFRLIPAVVVTQCVVAGSAVLAIRSGALSLEATAIVASAAAVSILSAAVLSVGRRLHREEAEREHVAAEMRRSHETFVRAVEGSSDGLWDWHVPTGEVYFSPRYKSMLGYSDSEVANNLGAWESLIHPDDLPRARKMVSDYHDGRIPVYELEHRMRHKDGSYRWILARGTILRDAEGKVVRMSGSHTDIDERKNIETVLRESEQRFRQVAENIREVIWLSDAEKKSLIYISPGYELVWGRTCRSLYEFPLTWMDSIHPDDRERVKTAAYTKQVRGDYDETYRIVRPDGETRWIRDRAFPVRDENGVVYRIAGLAEDVTERRLLDEELRSARDSALASDRAKSEFLANVSHEMRTPLNAIQGMCELLTAQPPPEPHATRARLAHEAVKMLTATINDLLDLAKIEAGRMALDPIEADVRRIFAVTLALFEAQASDKGLALSLDVAAGVPASILIDPLRLRQVVSNLLNNAIKFTEKGSVSVTVTAAPRGGGATKLEVSVKDTGIGIDAEAQKRLFQSFTQADASTTRRFGGTGLGLAICRRLVEAMGGEITLESAPGAGSTFRFSAAAPLAVTEKTSAPAAAEAPALSRVRALVVEDNEVNRRIALEMLSHLGVAADVAENGAKALELLRRSPYDIVFMDCSMPVMDGYEATARWRASEPRGARLPVIAMTAYALQGDKEKCLAAGMDDYLSKPLALKDFIAALSRWASPIDPAALAKAATLVGEAAPRWKKEFLEDARRLLAEMRAAQTPDELKRAAHTLGGSSVSLGARRLSVMCRRIEASGAATPGQLDEAGRELDFVAAALNA